MTSIPVNRNFELLKLKRDDIKIDSDAAHLVDRILIKYLQGEASSFTFDDLNVYFEVHLSNRKGWQKKVDQGAREVDLRSKSIISRLPSYLCS